MSYIDLHTHTTASDGTLTPRELVNLALESGLSAIAVTDHDTVEGVEAALEEGLALGLEVIPGVEISVDFIKETHILGYLINPYNSNLQITLKKLREFRKKRNPLMVERLNQLGFAINLEEVQQEAGGNVIGRPHIAKVLVNKGYVESIQEVFELYLAQGKPGYVPKEKLTAREAIRLIKDAEGVPVLAHPKLLQLSSRDLEEAIQHLVGLGLRGIEAYYSSHSEEETQYYLQLAERYNLLLTGGSDFHGSNKPEIKLGKGMGNLAVPYHLLVQLKNGSRNKTDS